jgi:3-hydroxyacyl-[acyl-carrier-protein] dehydratase
MKLLDHLYSIQSQHITKNKADFRIKLNDTCFIYKAHFPNYPITPGVCLIQMLVELLSIAKDENFTIKTLKNVKFTAPISPLKFSEIDFSLDFSEIENDWHIKAIIKEQETIFAKMSMILI